jgi:hypothetical protein
MEVCQLPLKGPWRIYAACRDRGDCPLLQFFNDLGPAFGSTVDGIWALLERVAEHGPKLNSTLSHQLSGDIYEFIKGRIRVLYFCERGAIIICTHGVLKGSQKIGRAEIERAETVMRTYRESVKANTLRIVQEIDHGS